MKRRLLASVSILGFVASCAAIAGLGDVAMAPGDGGAAGGGSGGAAGGVPEAGPIDADTPKSETGPDAPSCEGGAATADGACPIVVPRARLVSPMSTSRVSKKRPLLKYELPAGIEAAVLDICSDPACASVIESASAPHGGTRPSKDLPPGATFWRVRTKLGGGEAATPTWEFFAARRDAPNETVTGTVYDWNRDGRADLAVGAPLDSRIGTGTGRIYVFDGADAGPIVPPGQDLACPSPSGCEHFGASAASAGDVDGDGYGDLLVGAGSDADAGVGRGFLLFGGATTPLRSAELPHVAATSTGLGRVAGIGDADGDGYGDLAVATPDVDKGAGAVTVFYGSANGIDSTRSTALRGSQAGAALGTGFAGAGDWNGDGYADIAVGSPPRSTVAIYLGSPTGIQAAPYPLAADPVSLVGDTVAFGDFNGDGLSDVASHSAGFNLVGLWLGPSSNFAAGFRQSPAREEYSFGDFNGDGVADLQLAVANPTDYGAADCAGGADAALCKIEWLDLEPFSRGSFGSALSSGGDVNGDGYDDVILGAPCTPWGMDASVDAACGGEKSEGRAFFYFGQRNAGKNSSDRIFIPNAAGRFGSAVVLGN